VTSEEDDMLLLSAMDQDEVDDMDQEDDMLLNS
jgi:hypothetical protein